MEEIPALKRKYRKWKQKPRKQSRTVRLRPYFDKPENRKPYLCELLSYENRKQYY
jgi:hypothetical protein